MTTNERRKNERIPIRYEIWIRGKRPLERSFSRNFSKNGVCIEAEKSMEKGKQVKMLLKLPDTQQAKELEVNGVVRWVGKTEHKGSSEDGFLIGIEFEELNESQKKVIEEILQSFTEKRKTKRFYERCDVIFDDPESIQLEQVENMSQGGLFINTFMTLNRDSDIRMRLIVPRNEEFREICINGKVVFSLNKQNAEQMGTIPGIGIVVTDFPDEEDEQGFVEFLSDLEIVEGSVRLVNQ